MASNEKKSNKWLIYLIAGVLIFLIGFFLGIKYVGAFYSMVWKVTQFLTWFIPLLIVILIVVLVVKHMLKKKQDEKAAEKEAKMKAKAEEEEANKQE